MEDVNRIKLVMVEKKRTNKWLSEQMGVTPSTVSKWCTNLRTGLNPRVHFRLNTPDADGFYITFHYCPRKKDLPSITSFKALSPYLSNLTPM